MTPVLSLSLLASACGSETVVPVIPPAEVGWVSAVSLLDPSGPLDEDNFALGSGLYDLSAPFHPPLGALIVGFASGEIDRLDPPDSETMAQIAVRPIESFEPRDTLPRPVWLARTNALGEVEIIDTSEWRARVTADWIGELIWNRVLATPNAPPLHDHEMAYDSGRGAVLMAGGGRLPARTWSFDGTGWTDLGPLGTEARTGFAMAYDSSRSTMVAFGGGVAGAGPGCSDETWELDVDGAWIQRTLDPRPRPRCDAVMAFDAKHELIVLFGGRDRDDVRLDDTWTYDGRTWTELAGPAPDPRENAALTYDESREALVLFGGAGSPSQADTWVHTDGGWEELDLDPRPPGRSKHGMVYDRARRKLVMFGGWRGPSEYEDTWELDSTGWREIPRRGPQRRCLLAMAYDEARFRTVLYGGCDPASGCSELDDTWEYGVLSNGD